MKAHVKLKVSTEVFYNDIEGESYDECIGVAKGLFKSWLNNNPKFRKSKVLEAVALEVENHAKR